jgi:hypothetical protein
VLRLLPVDHTVGTSSTTGRPGSRPRGFAPSDPRAHSPEEGTRQAIARRRELPAALAPDPVALTHDDHRRGAMASYARIRSSLPAAEVGQWSLQGRGQGEPQRRWERQGTPRLRHHRHRGGARWPGSAARTSSRSAAPGCGPRTPSGGGGAPCACCSPTTAGATRW